MRQVTVYLKYVVLSVLFTFCTGIEKRYSPFQLSHLNSDSETGFSQGGSSQKQIELYKVNDLYLYHGSCRTPLSVTELKAPAIKEKSLKKLSPGTTLLPRVRENNSYRCLRKKINNREMYLLTVQKTEPGFILEFEDEKTGYLRAAVKNLELR